MATRSMHRIIAQLRQTAQLRDGAGLSDAQLLECFVARHEEIAFEAIVRRHGPMVLNVCLRVLRNADDAEDSFQATFLVLACKASTIQSKESVASWLYGVAYQTALKASATAAKRRTRERQVNEMPEPEAPQEEASPDWQPVLDRELRALPEKYRVPIILCDLEGKTRKDAAEQLSLPEGTLSSRLARARVMLAKRLARHGVTFSGGAIATLLSQNLASACVPASLVGSTVKAATMIAAGHAIGTAVVSGKVAALMEGVMKAMFLSKLKNLIMVMAFVCIAALGGGLLAKRCAKEQPSTVEPKASAKSQAQTNEAKPQAAIAEKNQQPLDKMQAAFDATQASLRSGIGTAQFAVYTAPFESKTFSLAIKAKASVAFIRKEFFVRLDYERNANDESNKTSIIVCDGENVFKNIMSNGVPNSGMTGHINEARRIGEGRLLGPRELAHLNPTSLESRTVHLPSIRKNYATTLTVTGDSKSGYVGSYKLHKAICEFKALPEHGFRVSSFKGYLDNKTHLFQSVSTTWERSGHVWYVKAVEEIETPKGRPATKITWTYETFEPNAKIPDSYFQFSALKFVERARIFDHRVKDRAVEYRNVRLPDADGARVEKIADHIKRLAETGQ